MVKVFYIILKGQSGKTDCFLFEIIKTDLIAKGHKKT